MAVDDTADLEAVAGPDISIVSPLHNERASLGLLLEECCAVLDDATLDWSALGTLAAGVAPRWEIIFVDDGSNDGSWRLIEELAARCGNVRAFCLRRNSGKSAALQVGFSHCRAPVVISLDADLQDDPREIPRMVALLGAGYDLVSGWKRKRRDSPARVAASRAFNFAVRRFWGLELHDFNCGFKAYRAEVVRNMRIYGELHRFIPVVAAFKGFRVGEIEVAHRPRRFGHSRYGWGRAFRGLMDLLTVLFLTRFDMRPAHFFGLPGALLLTVGMSCVAYVSYLRLAYGEILERHPLLIFGVLCSLAGLQLVTSGFLGEMLAAHLPRDENSTVIRARL
ncbi:MAG: glycosyltransferase family 2 protein [Deltaproteobacteria bacterium]